jgi:hypothetical protein
MVNFDEILLLVIGSLSLGFLNKNGKVPSIQTVGATRDFVNPYLDKLQTAQVQALEFLNDEAQTLDQVRANSVTSRDLFYNKNLEIGKNILDIERQRADIDIDFIQSNLDESRSYISQQQRVRPAPQFSSLAPKGEWQQAAQALLGKFSQAQIGGSLFPDFRLINNQENYNIVQQQAAYETAQANIQTAQDFALKAESKIIELNNAFNENFGDISRYS